jgi:hypothetical protein
MKEFRTINQIIPSKEKTWKNHVFLTFDMDWAIDDILENTISILEKADVSATWFITHKTPLLCRLRENKKFELGIHPNFNKLLFQSDFSNGKDAKEIVGRLMDLVPEAVSVRSHSLTQSSTLLDLFKEFGLSYDCNHFIPASLGYPLSPWKSWNEMVLIPHSWEDDIHIMYQWDYSITDILKTQGLHVFDFHPIHVALNTESLTRYENSRSFHLDWDNLQSWIFIGKGTRSHLEELLSFARINKNNV